MSDPLVILVGGYMTAGKDAFADFLVADHGFKKLGMSDTLAEALYRLNPVIPFAHPSGDYGQVDVDFPRYQVFLDEYMNGYVNAKTNPEVRRLLRILGTEVGRQLLGENIWVDAAKKKILELTEAGHNVVITGIRFPNELALEDHFAQWEPVCATSVWVDRPGVEAAAGTHSSEGSVSRQDFQYALDNDGDLAQLRRRSSDLLDVIVADYQ